MVSSVDAGPSRRSRADRRCGGPGGPGRADPRPGRCTRTRRARRVRRARRGRPAPPGRRPRRRGGCASGLVTPMWSATRSGGPGGVHDGGAVDDLGQGAAGGERQQGTHRLGGGLLGDHRQPTARDPGQVDAQVQGAAGEGHLQHCGVVAVGHQRRRATPSRRCSGFGTTRPAHTTSGEADAASSRVVPSPTVLRLAAATGRVPRPGGSRRSPPRTGRAGRPPARP